MIQSPDTDAHADAAGSSTSSTQAAPDKASDGEPGGESQDVLIGVVLAALADPMRRRILNVLSAAGGSTATVIARDMPVTRQAVVKHLSVLSDAGLVVARRIGREVRFSVAPAPLAQTARWMSELASEWDRPLQAVKRLAESGDPGAGQGPGRGAGPSAAR